MHPTIMERENPYTHDENVIENLSTKVEDTNHGVFGLECKKLCPSNEDFDKPTDNANKSKKQKIDTGVAVTDIASTSISTDVPIVELATQTNIKKLQDSKKALKNQQVIKDFHVSFKNDEGKSVCGLCRKTFDSVKALYFDLKSHSDNDWKTFFARVERGKKSSCPGLNVNHVDQDDEDTRNAAETLMVMTQDRFDGDLINTTESGFKMVHEFDLNVVPPMEEDDSTKLI